MEKFAIRAGETIEAQRNLFDEEAVEELQRNEDASSRVFNGLEDRLHNEHLDSSLKIQLIRRSDQEDNGCKIKNHFHRKRH